MKKTDKTTKHCCGNCAKYANKCRCRAYGRIADNYAKKNDNACMGFAPKQDRQIIETFI